MSIIIKNGLSLLVLEGRSCHRSSLAIDCSERQQPSDTRAATGIAVVVGLDIFFISSRSFRCGPILHSIIMHRSPTMSSLLLTRRVSSRSSNRRLSSMSLLRSSNRRACNLWRATTGLPHRTETASTSFFHTFHTPDERIPQFKASDSDRTPPPFFKLLAANRGEIATRINRAASELGVSTAGIYSHEGTLVFSHCLERFARPLDFFNFAA